MACPTVTSGTGFLAETLGHLDCQAERIGAYGFSQLAQAGSPANVLLTGLLTLFIALFAYRLLFGGRVALDDAVGAVLKIGIVLTLALSWPAFRTLAYDTVLYAPGEVAAQLTGDSVPGSDTGLVARLQYVDDAMARLTAFGTGRQSSVVPDGEDALVFRTIALQDEEGLGYARTLWLAGTIGPLAFLRVAAGVLLSLAPLIAGLLLFDFARGIFAGWVRGLLLVALGSLGMTVLLLVEVAVLEPMLLDALARRAAGYSTPNLPTELLALTLAFGLASLGLLYLLVRVAFQNGWPSMPVGRQRSAEEAQAGRQQEARARGEANAQPIAQPRSRALAVAGSVRDLVRREEMVRELTGGVSRRVIQTAPAMQPGGSGASSRHRPEPLGSAWRRSFQDLRPSQQRRSER